MAMEGCFSDIFDAASEGEEDFNLYINMAVISNFSDGIKVARLLIPETFRLSYSSNP